MNLPAGPGENGEGHRYSIHRTLHFHNKKYEHIPLFWYILKKSVKKFYY